MFGCFLLLNTQHTLILPALCIVFVLALNDTLLIFRF